MTDIEITGERVVATNEYARNLAVLAARGASDKKANNPVVMELGDLIGITDYFVICSAPNDRQVKTIVDEIEKVLREAIGIRPRAVEGLSDATWVLVDYGDIVVHVMSDEARAFYSLERLWADALVVNWEAVA